VVQQIERDNRVHDLVKTMASIYAFLEDANSLTKSHHSSIPQDGYSSKQPNVDISSLIMRELSRSVGVNRQGWTTC
jgi:hypothetical protein